jgi:hypothetical protein
MNRFTSVMKPLERAWVVIQNRAATILFVSLVLAFCIFDFATRVYVPSSWPGSIRFREIATMGELSPPPASWQARVASWLPQTAKSADVEVRRVKLLGVFRGAQGWTAVVVLVGATTGTSAPQRVRAGDTIEGWIIETIEPRGISLRRGEQITQEWLFDRV